MPKVKTVFKRGPRAKDTTVRCVVCHDPVETTRQDTLTCSPKCRKARSRWLSGGNVPVFCFDNMPPVRSKKTRKPNTKKGKANG